MRLTKRKAINISIELWTWLAKTGKWKSAWPGWEKYGLMLCYCTLCEYSTRRSPDMCRRCPYYQKFGCCADDATNYYRWTGASTNKARMRYASLFLEQLKQL